MMVPGAGGMKSCGVSPGGRVVTSPGRGRERPCAPAPEPAAAKPALWRAALRADGSRTSRHDKVETTPMIAISDLFNSLFVNAVLPLTASNSFTCPCWSLYRMRDLAFDWLAIRHRYRVDRSCRHPLRPSHYAYPSFSRLYRVPNWLPLVSPSHAGRR